LSLHPVLTTPIIEASMYDEDCAANRTSIGLPCSSRLGGKQRRRDVIERQSADGMHGPVGYPPWAINFLRTWSLERGVTSSRSHWVEWQSWPQDTERGLLMQRDMWYPEPPTEKLLFWLILLWPAYIFGHNPVVSSTDTPWPHYLLSPSLWFMHTTWGWLICDKSSCCAPSGRGWACQGVWGTGAGDIGRGGGFYPRAHRGSILGTLREKKGGNTAESGGVHSIWSIVCLGYECVPLFSHKAVQSGPSIPTRSLLSETHVSLPGYPDSESGQSTWYRCSTFSASRTEGVEVVVQSPQCGHQPGHLSRAGGGDLQAACRAAGAGASLSSPVSWFSYSVGQEGRTYKNTTHWIQEKLRSGSSLSAHSWNVWLSVVFMSPGLTSAETAQRTDLYFLILRIYENLCDFRLHG
jgi:hypothetical protein